MKFINSKFVHQVIRKYGKLSYLFQLFTKESQEMMVELGRSKDKSAKDTIKQL